MKRKRTRLSIDLCGPNEELISEESLVAVVSGCQNILKRLGPLAGTVETFRVVFDFFGGHLEPGPSLKVYFRDPLGNECTHSSDYRFVGSGKTNSSAKEIANAMCAENGLPRFITEHLSHCGEEIEKAWAELGKLNKKK